MGTLHHFEKQIVEREQCRKAKQQMEEEEQKRNVIMEQQRVAMQKQKYAKPYVDINDEAQFPSLAGGKSKSDSDKDQSVSPILRSYSSMTLKINAPKQPNAMAKAQSC